jgi:hypothetical protein
MTFDLRFGHPTNLMITGPTQVSLRIVYLKIPIIYNFFFFTLVREIFMDQETSSIEREDFQKSAEKSSLYILNKKQICRRIISGEVDR